MKYRALVSFSGALSMRQGEVRELSNEDIIKDLLGANYIEEIKEEPNKENELQNEIEELKKQIKELKKEPEPPVENTKKEPEQVEDVKPDEGKRNNSK